MDGDQHLSVSGLSLSPGLDPGHSLPANPHHGYLILSAGLSSLVSAINHHQRLSTGHSLWNHAGQYFISSSTSSSSSLLSLQALQNLGTALITIGAGHIVDRFGYYWLELFFTGWLLLSLVSGVAIWFIDHFTHGNLNLSAEQAAQMKQSQDTRINKTISGESDYRGL